MGPFGPPPGSLRVNKNLFMYVFASALIEHMLQYIVLNCVFLPACRLTDIAKHLKILYFFLHSHQIKKNQNYLGQLPDKQNLYENLLLICCTNVFLVSKKGISRGSRRLHKGILEVQMMVLDL